MWEICKRQVPVWNNWTVSQLQPFVCISVFRCLSVWAATLHFLWRREQQIERDGEKSIWACPNLHPVITGCLGTCTHISLFSTWPPWGALKRSQPFAKRERERLFLFSGSPAPETSLYDLPVARDQPRAEQMRPTWCVEGQTGLADLKSPKRTFSQQKGQSDSWLYGSSKSCLMVDHDPTFQHPGELESLGWLIADH